MKNKISAAVLSLLLVAGALLAADKPLSDNGLSDMILIKLSGDREVKGGALKVDVKDGVATLSGTLETQRLKDKAGKLARGVKGVKQVINNITLKEKTAPA
jgi:hyperosmotically inducible periplasmic protein